MSRFLRIFACLGLMFFVGNALAAGYTCPSYKKYTSCNSGYYMTSSSSSTTCNTTPATGNACRPCSVYGSNYTCAGGTSCPKASTVTCSAGYYLPANGSSCSACGGNGYWCPGGTFTPSSSAQGRNSVSNGYYTTGGTSTTRTGQTKCEAGYYCSGGVRNACSGSLQYQDTTGATSCKSVSTGYYKSSNSAQAQCPSGYRNIAATSQSECVGSFSKTGSQVNGSTPTNCYSVTAWNSCTPGTCTYTKKYSGTIVSDCTPSNCTKTADTTTGKAGYYGYSNGSGQACSSCSSFNSSYPSSDNGAANSNYCYATKTKTGSQVNGSTPTNCYSVTAWNSCTPGTCTYKDYYGATDTTCTPTNCTKTAKTTTGKAGYYGYSNGSGQACSSCSSFNSSYPSSDNGAANSNYCYATKTKTGSQVNGSVPTNCASVTSWNSCTPGTCTYKDYYGVTDTTCTPSNCTKTPAAVTANSGYYDAGTTCSACPSEYPNSDAGNDGGITKCYSNTKSRAWTGSQTSCSLPTGCESRTCNSCSNPSCDYVAYSNSAGTGDGTVKSGCSTNNASCQQTVKSVTASAGRYVSGTSCPACAAGTYQGTDGSTATSCSACTGRTKYSAAGASACSTVTSGYYTTGCNSSGNNCTGQSACGGNAYYCSGGVRNNVSSGYYSTGGTSTTRTGQSQCTGATYCSGGVQNNCPTNYDDETATAGKTSASQCKINCSGGYRVTTANGTCSAITSGNVYIGAHSVSYGSTSPAATSCPTSYTISGTTAADHDAKSDCKISCAAGTRVASADAACTTPTGSWYTSAHTVSAGSTSGTNVKSCVTGYATANTSTSTDHDASTDCKISCAAGTRVASANATCTTPSGNWYVGAHTVSQGSTSSVSSCLTNYTISGTAATNHDTASDCKISCSGGTYLASTNATSCSSVGTGYWAAASTVSQGSTSSRTQCPAGYRDGAAASAQSGCKMNVPAAEYVKTANDAESTACGTGTYKAAHTVNYGSTSTCSSCPSGYDDGAAGAAQSDCKMSVAGGKYVATANSATQSTCANWTYKAAHTVNYGSTSSCSSCPALTSGWSKKDSAGTGWSSLSSCVQVSGTPSNCASGNLKQTAASSTTWGSSSVNTALSANPKYYVNGTSCSACPAGSYCTGGTAAATKCAIGSYSTGTASACTVCGAGKTTASTGTTAASSCTSCTSISGLSTWATPSWSANTVSNLCTVGTCSANYYKSGNTCPTCSSGTNGDYTKSSAGTTSVNSCYLTTTAGNYVATAKAGQVTCAAGGWCPGNVNIYYGTGTTTGGRTACSTLGTGYTNTSTGQSSNTSCYLPVAAGSVRVGTSGTTLDTCDAGTYKGAHNAYYGTEYSCSVCGNNQYSNAGAGSCTACNTTNGYTNSGTSASSHAGVASCKTTCDAGEYVASAGAACSSVGTGYWAASKTVSQGSTSSRTQCPAGYRDGAAAGAQNQCKMNVPAAEYVKTANDAESTACGTGTYKAAHTVNYGSTSTCSSCPSGYDDGAAGAAQSSCKINCSGGYRVTTANGTCSAITSGNVYIGAHSVSYGSTSPAATSCPTSYTISGTTAADHDAKSDCKISCAAGTRVASADAACTTPTGSWYTSAHTVSAGSTSGTNVKSCVTGYATANTSTSTDHDASTDCKISCAAGTRVASANATCTTPSGNWYVGAHTVSQGSTSSVSSCLTNYTISGTVATNHDAANDCKITCSGGSYIAAANNTSCSAVGAGYWAAASTVSQGSAGVRNACDAGLTTIGSGAGADEAADCGRVLNFNGEKIYLRSESKTTPSLNVSINGTTYYGNMSTATKGSLRIKSGTTTYSVYDDSM